MDSLRDNFKIDASRISSNIEPFFTAEEMKEMSEYEKKALRNMRSNYEALLMMGCFPEKPDFMKSAKEKKKLEKKLEKEDEEKEDDDAEWLPSYKKKNHLTGCKAKVSVPKMKTEIPKFLKRTPVKPIPSVTRVLREKPATCMQLEVLPEDSFIYCEDCKEEYVHNCPTHGPLVIITDTEVKQHTSNYAEKTAPNCVVIKKSCIPNAGLGVFASELIPYRVRFGPYKGEITGNEGKAQLSGYSWQIYSDAGKASHFIDAQNPKISNWMRFVNCARNESEQNLFAFQFLDEVYYKTLRRVSIGEELLVWYGEDYAKHMGISSSKKQAEVKDTQTVIPDANFKIFTEKQNHKECMVNHRERPFHCDICSQRFTAKCSLKTHMLIHSGEKPFHCDICSQRFSRTDSLKTHMLIHSGEKPFHCDICSQRFIQTGHLKTHMLIHSGEKPFHCDICSQRFTRTGSVKTHMLIHSGEKPFHCDICSQRFIQTGHLKTHMLIHSGEKPFHCDICSQRFTRTGSLKTHMLIHSEEKPFHCDICSQRFIQTSNLKTHMIIHSGEKPFHCDICSQRFTQTGNLKKHMLIHSGEKPFHCDICSQRFTEKGSLKRHMLIHSGEKPFHCAICSQRFTQKISLKKHLVIHK